MKTLASRRKRTIERAACVLSILIFSIFCIDIAPAGELQSIRDEVRQSNEHHHNDHDSDRRHRYDEEDYDDEEDDQALALSEVFSVFTLPRSIGWGGGMAYDRDHCHDERNADHAASGPLSALLFHTVTAPFLLPRTMLGDEDQIGSFPKFPYHQGAHFMVLGKPERPWIQQPRLYSGRVRMEYGENFREFSCLGGQLQVETASRLGIDTEAHRLEERLSGGGRDHLWLGDCNLTYRFAQSERAAWRAGLGFNWLDDPAKTHGFNFTYGFDLYPRRPWVFSTALDVGTLGKSELFRFRTTAGIMLRRLETYVGYEYLNVAGTTYNGLIGGVGIHF